jgi:hypothetical protein
MADGEKRSMEGNSRQNLRLDLSLPSGTLHKETRARPELHRVGQRRARAEQGSRHERDR